MVNFSDLAGTPQGCVLSPLQYIMSTSSDSGKHIWYAEVCGWWWACYAEMKSLALLLLDIFTTWCQESFLVQNASKSKDMLIDFRLPRSSPVIDGQNIGTVESCEYFRTIFDNRFNFEYNTDSAYRERNQRLLNSRLTGPRWTCFIDHLLSLRLLFF